MVSLQYPSGQQPELPERIGFKVTIAHVLTTAIIAIMAVGAYLTLEQALRVQRAAATTVALTERQLVLSERVSSLVAQYALGNIAVRSELGAAVGAFETTHWQLVSGDRSRGIASAVADPQLREIYFDGTAPLDAAATEFITRARRIAAMSPQNPLLGAQTAPIFAAAEQSLPEGLENAQRARGQQSEQSLNRLRSAAAAACVVVLLALLASTIVVFRTMAQHILSLTLCGLELGRLATVDPLTGMLNRRTFQTRGAIEIQKARRHQRPLSLLRIDADQLGLVEDTYGPEGSETLLRALTASIFDGTRVSDLVARVDAERFAILLPETDCDGAELLAERLRRKINELKVSIDNKLVPCTISVGVAAAEKDDVFLWPTFKRADEAVYEAKLRGCNRVVVANTA
jgi:diguanylate cyclase (GGDEF)-like protein